MNLVRSGTIIAVVGAAYLVGFWPTWAVRDAVLAEFGNPAYQGVWIVIPHVFLYTTLQAVFCFAAWIAFAGLQWIPGPRLSFSLPAVGWGLIAGVLSIGIVIGFLYATGQQGALHEPQPDPWVATANIFSNFYEEFVFRGFILVALAAVIGFWPAAIVSSIAFGATHTQYPLPLQALIAGTAMLWAWVTKRTGDLMAPYLAHMTMDLVVDPIL